MNGEKSGEEITKGVLMCWPGLESAEGSLDMRERWQDDGGTRGGGKRYRGRRRKEEGSKGGRRKKT